jgi:phenylalanyl-tRNA synthetase beta chain
LTEAQGQTLLDAAAAALAPAEQPGVIPPLENPLSSDMSVLRPSLLPGLLDGLRHNLSRKCGDVALFEIGRVFALRDNACVEQRRVAIALTGQRNPLFWSGTERDAKLDVHDLKGVVEEFLDQFGLRGVSYARRPEPTPLLAESAVVSLGRQPLGELGQMLPSLARRYDLRDPVFLAEFNLDLLLARRQPGRTFKPLPVHPAIRRDIAMLVPEETTHETVLGAVRQAKPPFLESVELFDVFRGQHIPPGQKSLAYAFIYRSPDRNLTDTEVNTAHQQVIERFKGSLKATIRDAG